MLLLEAAEAERMEFIRNQVLPWSACFVAAIREGAFWNRELSTPATLFLSRNKREVANDDNEDSTAKPADHPRSAQRPEQRADTPERTRPRKVTMVAS